MKDGDFWERGEVPTGMPGQGKRNDLLDVKARIEQGEHLWDIARDDTTFSTVINNHRALGKYETSLTVPRNAKTIVTVHWGAPRLGKTCAAYRSKHVYSLQHGNSGSWWDGYEPNRHTTVVLDEFTGSALRMNDLKKLMDRYPIRMETKGGHVEVRPRFLIITSNDDPRAWYTKVDRVHVEAVEKRIDNEFQWFEDAPGWARVQKRKGTWKAFPLFELKQREEWTNNDAGVSQLECIWLEISDYAGTEVDLDEVDYEFVE
jgi:hypothetical protein